MPRPRTVSGPFCHGASDRVEIEPPANHILPLPVHLAVGYATDTIPLDEQCCHVISLQFVISLLYAMTSWIDWYE